MSEPGITGLTGRRVLMALIALAALGAAAIVAVTLRHDQPMKTNAVDSASSDLAASAAH
ncbi:hypothetical protein [Phenylobacterium sp.]|jgi:hypothetical protein|uniref:hypothetical protein n=1 Tax=Phenylobacterium sp. TaxID=1871053 RepID=UPI002E31F07F|nr:hypothetical protein [Phenylobacterium sp.]HEX3367555.1 hypothetical protein [Phenylobacterium sp.]